ncbi:MAG: hypothetical protein H7A21_19640 [Spirochaetales bacterium]|nr:hypothetical protein [Leptospiraceae bacterium]MCP5483660.1 hypothetical protein [Spirochaetales bacterium]
MSIFRSLTGLTLLAFLLQLLFYLAGHVSFRTSPATQVYTSTVPLYDFPENISGGGRNAQEDEPMAPPADVERSGQLRWEAGLVEKVLTESRLLNLFEDEQLESESRPDALLRGLSRTLTADTTRLVLTLFWIVLILLTLVARHESRWFYRPMAVLVLSGAVLVTLFSWLTIRRASAHDDRLLSSDAWIFGAIDLAFILLGSAAIMRQILPPGNSEPAPRPFLDHMRGDRILLSERARLFLRSTWQVALVATTGVVISNLVLLPIYSLQVNFPRFFGFLLLAGILGLSYFYVRAYMNVARSQGQADGISSGVAFLGFRLLRNTLFIVSILILVSLVATLVVGITVQNTSFLEAMGVLVPPESLQN